MQKTLDQELMRATAEDMADVFRKVNTDARKGQWQRPKAGDVIWFPKIGT